VIQKEKMRVLEPYPLSFVFSVCFFVRQHSVLLTLETVPLLEKASAVASGCILRYKFASNEVISLPLFLWVLHFFYKMITDSSAKAKYLMSMP
jgi:hypothetical protein